MKAKLLPFLMAICLLALAAWLVHRNNGPTTDIDFQNGFARGAQVEKPNSVQADAVPEKYRETVRKGLEFLAKNQHKDGHWEGDGGKHPVAMTGLVGLALLMESGGERMTLDEPKYAANTYKAADWLMAKSQALIYSGHSSETARYMQGHGLATLFLAGAPARTRDSIPHAGSSSSALTRQLHTSSKAAIEPRRLVPHVQNGGA